MILLPPNTMSANSILMVSMKSFNDLQLNQMFFPNWLKLSGNMAMCKIFITIGGFQRHRAIKIPSLNNTDIYDIKSEL